MICFQSIIFDILKTTLPPKFSLCNMLWFAFNLLSLTYWKQLYWTRLTYFICCDLLSIYYLWHTENNNEIRKSVDLPLWFAFNLLSLTYWKQRSIAVRMSECVVICFQSIIFDILKTTGLYHNAPTCCCDLLSIYYLWHTENNIRAFV